MFLGEALWDERREKGLYVNRGGRQLGWGLQRGPWGEGWGLGQQHLHLGIEHVQGKAVCWGPVLGTSD